MEYKIISYSLVEDKKVVINYLKHNKKVRLLTIKEAKDKAKYFTNSKDVLYGYPECMENTLFRRYPDETVPTKDFKGCELLGFLISTHMIEEYKEKVEIKYNKGLL